jgi:hypothetical protein
VTEVFKRAKSLLGGLIEPAPKPVAVKRPVNRFHAVSIAPGPRACPQARSLLGQRFLSSEAPALPLKGCSQPECTCRYAHYEDRRKQGRRARDLGVAIDGYEGPEQRARQKRGRRTTDT